MVNLFGKIQRLAKVVRPREWGALLRFPFDLIVAGDLIIGNGAFDTDSEIQEDGIWMLQIEVQGPGDSYFPYHPSGLLLQRLGGEATLFRRVGYSALNEDYIEFFNSVETKEICLV